MSYKMTPEERDKTLALVTSEDYRAEVAANYALSAARINSLFLADPFPQPDRHEFYGLQPVKKDWTDLQRAWRVKKGVFRGGLILASVSTYGDRLWYHVSFSLRDRIPSYEQMMWVRQTIFPSTLKVLQIFPPLDEHYSFHPNCLHLWACLEEDLLPDFRTRGAV
jgi:hypothetical protein